MQLLIRSPGEGKGERNCQMNARRIVRVEDAQWNAKHEDLLRQLSEDVLELREEETNTPFDELLGISRVRSGKDWVYLLYGPECYMDSENKLADVRGLVFEQIAQINRQGKLVVHM